MSDTRAAIAQALIDTVLRFWRLFAADLRRHPWPGAPSQFGALMLLAQSTCDLTALATQLHVTLATMSRTVDAMVARGWVQRTADADDHRRVLVALTPNGREALVGMDQAAMEHLEAVLALLSPEECSALLAGLNILARLVDDGTIVHKAQIGE